MSLKVLPIPSKEAWQVGPFLSVIIWSQQQTDISADLEPFSNSLDIHTSTLLKKAACQVGQFDKTLHPISKKSQGTRCTPFWEILFDSLFFFPCLHLARAQNEHNTKQGQSVMRTRTSFYTTIPRTPHRHTSLYVRTVTSLWMLHFLEVQFSRVEALGALQVGIYRLERSCRIVTALWEPLVLVREPAFWHWAPNT